MRNEHQHHHDEAYTNANRTIQDVNAAMRNPRVANSPRNRERLMRMYNDATNTIKNYHETNDRRMDMDDVHNDLRNAMDMLNRLLPHADDTMDDAEMARRGYRRRTRVGGYRRRSGKYVRGYTRRADMDDYNTDMDYDDYNDYADRMDAENARRRRDSRGRFMTSTMDDYYPPMPPVMTHNDYRNDYNDRGRNDARNDRYNDARNDRYNDRNRTNDDTADDTGRNRVGIQPR